MILLTRSFLARRPQPAGFQRSNALRGITRTSVESNIPTFREAQTGLWAKYNPEELATSQAFRRNSKLVWEWYAWRRELVAQARPNPGHLALAELPPRCPRCGGYLRPDVVWFGESLPPQALQAAFEAGEQCDLFLPIGTSALVQPAASLPLVALERGTVTVEINPDTTPLTPHTTYTLRGPAGQILPGLVKRLEYQ